MVKFNMTLPPYTVFRLRKGGVKAFYFIVPKRLCPDNWLPVVAIGRDDKMPIEDIIKRARELNIEFDKTRREQDLGLKRKYLPGTLPDVIEKYRESDSYQNATKRTQKYYDHYLRDIVEWSRKAGHPHISTLTPKLIASFLKLMGQKVSKDEYGKDVVTLLHEKKKKFKTIMLVLFNTAVIEGYVETNIVREIRFSRERKERRQITIWTDDDVLKFVKHADLLGYSSLGTAVLIAYETGQRMGDVLRMQQPRDYKDGTFRFRQSKTNAPVMIKITKMLGPRLEKIPPEQLLLVPHDHTKKMWGENAFSQRVRYVADSAGMKGYIFQNLRHSSLLNSERAGLSDDEISHKFGWSRATVKAIRDMHYGTLRDEEIANATVEKLDNYRNKRDMNKV